MKQLFSLEQVITKDGVTLTGVVALPKKSGKIAVIWFHGLGSSFYRGDERPSILAQVCTNFGYAFASFNTRGHDIATFLSGDKKRQGLGGSGFEQFERCIFDIEAVVRYMSYLGYKKIILVGHSTGANKIVYYLSKKNNRRVIGAVLAGALSDVPSELRRLGRKYSDYIKHAEALYGRDHKTVLPIEKFGYVMSAQRYLSLYKKGSREDVFPAYNPNGNWKSFERITTSLCIIMGGEDEHLIMPVAKYLELLKGKAKNASRVETVIISGSGHSFHGYERKLAQVIISFVKKSI